MEAKGTRPKRLLKPIRSDAPRSLNECLTASVALHKATWATNRGNREGLVTFAAHYRFFKLTFYKSKMLNKAHLTLLAAMFFAVALSAQTTFKYGHMNLGNLVEQLPDVKAAEAQLKIFADKLTAIDDSLTKSFQADYERLAKAYQAGELPAIEAQKQQDILKKRQEVIQAFEESANKQVTDKRSELLKPILDKVQEAVNMVAKESGYAMVFDTSSGAALYALETEDITPLVKKKLGL